MKHTTTPLHVRLPVSLIADSDAQAEKEGVTRSAFVRAALMRAVGGEGAAAESARLRERVNQLELEIDFFKAKADQRLKATAKEISKGLHTLARDLNREYHSPVGHGPEPADGDE